MQLTIVRHAPASARSASVPDRSRALTPKGTERFRKAVTRLQHQGVRFESVWSSPWRRAIQTAELMNPLTSGPIETTQLLSRTPGRRLLERLASHGGRYRSLALVGHEPWLSELVSLLLLGTGESADAFRLGKGSVCVLEGEPRPACMTLRSLQTLRQLRR